MPTALELGRYRELRALGRGGMGQVTLADDTLLGRQVALKRLHAGLGQAGLQRLRREAQVGASLSHPNLVAVFDIFDTDDGVVVVMEYVEGETLRSALRAGPLDPARATAMVASVAAGLDHIHARGLLHRDVKPGNVLLDADGQVKLADLGLAGGADLTRLTSSGAVLGTVGYMALEQLEGGRATGASDVHALAVMAYEMLSGQRPRRQANPLALARAMLEEPPPDLRRDWPQAPPAAAELLVESLSSEPERRPASAGALADALRCALAPAGTARRPPAPLPTLGSHAAGDRVPTSRSPRERGDRSSPPVAAVEPATLTPSAVSHADEHRRPRPAVLLSGVLLALAAVVAVALIARSGPHRPSTAVGKPSRTAGGPSASAGSGSSRPGGAGAPVPAGGAPNAATPVGAVESFYSMAAAQHPDRAWVLADPEFRAQLAGYDAFAAQQSTLRSISFPQAYVTSQDPTSATVALRTVATHVNRVDRCAGRVRLTRGPAGWLLHRIDITC